MWVVDAAEDMTWRELRYEGQPGWLSVRLKLAPTSDGVAVAGVQVERRDGRALTARDLRLVKLPPNWVLFGESAARWFPPAEGAATVAASKKGAHGKGDQHWRAVWLAWRQAMEAAPRAPVKFLLASGRWEVGDATMRRWITRARERAAEVGWDQEELPREAGGFLRQPEARPGPEPFTGTPDSP